MYVVKVIGYHLIELIRPIQLNNFVTALSSRHLTDNYLGVLK